MQSGHHSSVLTKHHYSTTNQRSLLYSLFARVFNSRFIWIMGVSITLSFRSLRRQKTSRLKIAYKIIKRSIILFGLGLFTSNCEFQFNTKGMPI